MNKEKALSIINYLETLYPNYPRFLNFTNNFELIVAVVLSAQTTDARVNMVTPALFAKYPTPEALAKAQFQDVMELVKTLGLAKSKAENIIKLAQDLVSRYNGEVPHTKEDLESLAGVGPKTANVVLALGFNIPAFPVDTHVRRLAIRLGFAKPDANLATIEAKLKYYIPKDKWINSHHLLILYGRNVCLARNPHCATCQLQGYCKEYKNASR